MDITEGNLQIFYGWLLGVLGSIITPFLVAVVQKWQDKRNFKRIIREDMKLKLSHLKSNNEQITLLLNGETLDSLIAKLPNYQKKFLVVHDNISTDLYNQNYIRFLEYFNNKPDLLKFYQSISRLTLFTDILEDSYNKSANEYNVMFLTYWSHLQHLISDGEKISI
ncbi:MAG: hypothetical protein FIB08_09325 [Candidatus Methanoperedens sp.]|nr:hypothetical protein [Candidatus Methanoperedens sp.]